MATARVFRRIARSLEGTVEAPHFERTAFKVKRIYAMLAPDGRSAKATVKSIFFGKNKSTTVSLVREGNSWKLSGP
jgi:hypothetical protein